ncbi:MAG: transporter substrate-binding domain-containing protein [Treponema sp.]|nr:transporter substrate-binding domain-containing protein [Treponema sp.]
MGKKSGNIRRWNRKFVYFSLFLAITAAGCTGRRTVSGYPNYNSYLDIPGVSEQEIHSIELIKSQRESFIYAMNYSTESFSSDNGDIGGFAALLCNWLGNLFGIPFKPVIVSWDELIAGLESHTIDFTGELTATEEREKLLFMTGTIAERPVKIIRLTGSDPLSVLGRIRPLRFAFLEGSTGYELASVYLPDDFEAFFISDYDRAYEALKNSEIDAFIEDGPAEAAFDSYDDIFAEDFFPLIYSHVSLATQNNELLPFISVIQKALDSGVIFHLTRLYNRGYQDYLRHRLFLQLTREEKEYIRTHSSVLTAIKICAEYDNYPSSFYNYHDKEWQGTSFDVLRRIEQYTGLVFEVVNKPYTEWTELLFMLESGQTSIITEMVMSADREGHFIWSHEPYQLDFYALLSAVELENLNINEVLYTRVGLIAESAYTEMFRQWFPRHNNTFVYTSNLDALNGLARGEVDLVMASKNQLLSIINFLERPGFKANIVFNHPSDSYFGFNKNEEVLRSIVSKAQKMINTEEISSRWERRVFDYRHKMTEAQLPWLIGVTILLFIVLFLSFIMLQRNRSEGKKLELLVGERTKELESASKAAMVASRTKSEFLANMSHEIRTPLNAVTGMAAIARSSSDMNRIYDCLDKINIASRQLLGIINDILDMSKIEAQRLELSREPFSLEAMAHNVRSIISVRAAEKRQRFIIDINPDIPKVVIGDEIRFSQILLNLLSNAIKFTPAGGEIQLILRHAGEKEGKEEIEAVVQDTGIGITEEQRERLFSAFVQADSGTSKRFGGTGLGLAISKSLAVLMGGDISVESTPGSGSRFIVRVLFEGSSHDTLRASQIGRKSIDYNFKNRTLLLVEDVPINREIVIALLENTGAEIDCAENGQTAVELFVANPERYDLVYMDVQMPVMDGYDAARAIRMFESDYRKKTTTELQNETGKVIYKRVQFTPIIAMTANAFTEDVENCKKAGMNDHIAKPIEVEALLTITDKYLNSRQETESRQ